MSYAYAPKYKLVLLAVNPGTTTVSHIFQVNSLQTLSAGLTTDTNYGTLSATWAETDFSTYAQETTRPTPMMMVQLWLYDRQGHPWPSWTGYVNSLERVVQFGQSTVYILSASTPYKLFDITLQTVSLYDQLGTETPGNGVLGTKVLKMAAKASGFPGALASLPSSLGWNYTIGINNAGTPGTIDYASDTGLTTWATIPTGIFVSPAQQTWSSVLQTIIGNTEIECFFNEKGQLVWRPLAYLKVPYSSSNPNTPSAITIQKDQILSSDFMESDQGVLTDIYVRFGPAALYSNQGHWPAPATLARNLGKRAMVFYAPWLTSTSSADALANALGLRYSGNIFTNQLTTLVNPTILLGTTIRVPKFPDKLPIDNTLNKSQNNTTPFYYFYVYGIQHNLQVGGQWTTQYDLRYGRNEQLQFPYFNDSFYLLDMNPVTMAGGTQVGQNNTPVTTSNTGFSLSQNSALPKNFINADLTTVPAGSEIILRDPATGHQIFEGYVAGPKTPGYQSIHGPSVQVPNDTGMPITVTMTVVSTGIGASSDVGANATANAGTIGPQASSSGGQPPIGNTPPTNTPGSGVVNGPNGTLPGQGTSQLVCLPVNYPVNSTDLKQGFGSAAMGNNVSSLEPSYPYNSGSPPFHTGIDIPVGTNTPLYAMGNGVVVSQIPLNTQPNGTSFGYGKTATWATGDSLAATGGYGWSIVIQYGQFYVIYGHMIGPTSLPIGSSVGPGSLVGYSDSSGNVTGPHLHLGIYDTQATNQTLFPGVTGMFINPLDIVTSLPMPQNLGS